jgi:hypothetical protein
VLQGNWVYAGSSVTTNRVTQAGQTLVEEPDEVWPSGSGPRYKILVLWFGVGVGLTALPHKALLFSNPICNRAKKLYDFLIVPVLLFLHRTSKNSKIMYNHPTLCKCFNNELKFGAVCLTRSLMFFRLC